MMDLKELVFFRANAEADGYDMVKNGTYSKKEIELQEQRFLSAYQIIEEAMLKNEYRRWKAKNGYKAFSCER
ncbi:MAG: hypothetical protein LIO87_00460 [Eubacterium sp.]|nr:hypothetical protein [Eubacterium sp.]